MADEYTHKSISMRASRWKMLRYITARIAGRNRSRAVEMLVEEKHEQMKGKRNV